MVGQINNYQNKNIDSLVCIADDYYCRGKHEQAIEKYEKILSLIKEDSSDNILKQLAYCYIKIGDAEIASVYIEKYIQVSLDVSFIDHSYFKDISNVKLYTEIADRYKAKTNLWTTFCLCIGFMGIFVAVVLNFRKRSDRIGNLLMSAFVMLHSFFILHLYLLLTNYHYYLPHTLYFSTTFSFLYGPLIYFYFKRIKIDYTFKKSDILHAVPTLLLIVLLSPMYVLSEEEKLRIMVLNDNVPYSIPISLIKLVSLYFYGILIYRIYIKSMKNKRETITKIEQYWQRNIFAFCSLYVITYTIFTILVIQSIDKGFLFNIQVASMVLLVLYVSYTALVQPSIFGHSDMEENEKPDISHQKPKVKLSRYKNSGLTESLSLELKERLLFLLDSEKVYKQNDITLQKLSELLGTTRHNTSQVINEHFNLNFFDLINSYRIKEAKKILRLYDGHKQANIIDVIYEVGFNNKVTFYKSFRKYNKMTPSEYIKLFVA
ncbi:hypothetical protein GCM10022258_01400 [Aquimarina gracilis]